MTRCICDFAETCDGSGWVPCNGCGGDLCVCAECYGQGNLECEGCSECREHADDDDPPYVCPGCHAVFGEPCAPDCIDAEIERDARERHELDVDDNGDEVEP